MRPSLQRAFDKGNRDDDLGSNSSTQGAWHSLHNAASAVQSLLCNMYGMAVHALAKLMQDLLYLAHRQQGEQGHECHQQSCQSA